MSSVRVCLLYGLFGNPLHASPIINKRSGLWPTQRLGGGGMLLAPAAVRAAVSAALQHTMRLSNARLQCAARTLPRQRPVTLVLQVSLKASL